MTYFGNSGNGLTVDNSMFNEFLNQLIFLGGGLALIMALSQFFTSSRREERLMLAIFYGALAVLLIEEFIILRYGGAKAVLGLYPVGFDLFLIGPGLYLYYRLVFDRNFTLGKFHLLHFIPAAGSVVLKAVVSSLPVFEGGAGGFPSFRYWLFYGYALFGIILLAGYFIIILSRLSIPSLYQGRRKNHFYILTMTFALSGFFIMIMITAAHFLGILRIFQLSVALLSVNIIAWFFVGIRYPGFITSFRKEVKALQYQRSLIVGLDVKLLQNRLEDLMVEEKIFRDEEVTLAKMAEMLQVTPHQLSEFLNRHYGEHFNVYVNRYRVDEAMELLTSSPDLSITAIAYRVGFNSKSAFYRAFSRVAGVSPSRYRVDYLQII